jgi:hypothetical protein
MNAEARRASVTRAARATLLATVAVAAVITTSARMARAADDLAPAIEVVGPRGSIPRGRGLWQVSGGWRDSLVKGAGYDLVSDNDVLATFVLTATRAFRTGPRFATALGGIWETGSAEADARGQNARLSLTRLGVVAEERFAPRPWGYAFVRVAPVWLHGSVALADPASPAPLETSFSTYAVDASGGVAARLNPVSQAVGFWAVAEAGYGWVSPQSMALAPALPAADSSKAGVTRFDDLDLRGALLRFALALSY